MRKKRLSISRLLLLLTIIGVSIYKLITVVEAEKKPKIINDLKPWFAAYVDVTAKPQYDFEKLGSTSTPNVVLAFIVSAKDDPCIPTWGTYLTLDQAATSLDLDRRIERLRQQGGNIAISFGGAINDELANKCSDVEKLKNAYTTVINRYNIDTIDLDIENDAASTNEVLVRRAAAIAKIQKERKENNKNLAVWLTLPVIPSGLTPVGTNVISQMLLNGVDIAGINVMTMDYGESKDKNLNMGEASIQALIETHRQLGVLYKRVGINLSDTTLWKKIGATPMIGHNDVKDEIFTLEDAATINDFAIKQNIGRMSMWSANRDQPCGENYLDVKKVSDSCSGVKTPANKFSQTLSTGFIGDITENSVTKTIPEVETKTEIIDDPEQSPYQIWQATGTYPKGVKVVWHKNVYEAKWWTKNDLPDDPVLQAWETPWKLIGPVMPGDKPIKQATLPKGTYPNWSGTQIYDGGDRVLFEGIPFQAKWWTQGDSPAISAYNPDSSPWVPLTQDQIEKLLKEIK